MPHFTNRRTFLRAAPAAAIAPYLWTSAHARAADKNDRPNVALIGCGGKARDNARQASNFADIIAYCDVDRSRAERFAEGTKAKIYEDYRKLLERADIDAVVCSTPDHWHTPIYVAALKAGKHVYGEKPLTLTIDEGKVLRRVLAGTDRVFQVGAQQRSAPWFRRAVAIARSGILGGKLAITCDLGAGSKGGPFAPSDPPPALNWDFWLGQAPWTEYLPQRCHGSFRWWREYSGGKLTDWGAHHIDIAQWAVGAENSGPVEIEGSGVFDDRPNCFNTAQTFNCTLTFTGGHSIRVTSGRNNGILIEGEKERIYVNRARLAGNLIGNMTPEMESQVDAEMAKLYDDAKLGFTDDSYPDVTEFSGGLWNKVKVSHMGNFFGCIRDGGTPVSNVESLHRTASSCHLCNIAMLLERPLKWDAEKEDFVGDAEASAMVRREQREGYEI